MTIITQKPDVTSRSLTRRFWVPFFLLLAANIGIAWYSSNRQSHDAYLRGVSAGRNDARSASIMLYLRCQDEPPVCEPYHAASIALGLELDVMPVTPMNFPGEMLPATVLDKK